MKIENWPKILKYCFEVICQTFLMNIDGVPGMENK